jgi:GTP-binding protein
MAGTDDRNPTDDFLHLKEELRLHMESLSCTPYLVLANKMDTPGADKNLKEFKDRTDEKIFEISAELGDGLEPVKEFLHKHFFDTRKILEETAEMEKSDD